MNEEIKKIWDFMIAGYIFPDATAEEKEDIFNQLIEEEGIKMEGDEIHVSYGNDFYAFNSMGFLLYELVEKKE